MKDGKRGTAMTQKDLWVTAELGAEREQLRLYMAQTASNWVARQGTAA